MFLSLNVQKNNESSFTSSAPKTAGSSISFLPVVGLGAVNRACHQLRYFS
jgi:hypothetical protein